MQQQWKLARCLKCWMWHWWQRGSSGCLASTLDLILLANNKNNTIPTQKQNRGILQFLCLPNIVIVEKQPGVSDLSSMKRKPSNSYGFPVFINQIWSTPSLTTQSISFSTMHGVKENYCATTMRSGVFIAIALWCHGWVELIKGIKGDHCCCRHWLCKIIAGWQYILVNDKERKQESRQNKLYLRNDGIHQDLI